jgi:phage-related holin
VALVGPDDSEERIASIIRVTDISSQRASFGCYCYVVPSSPIIVTLVMETILSSETSIVTRATRLYILEDGILNILSCRVLL